jgi:hypothetical protein
MTRLALALLSLTLTSPCMAQTWATTPDHDRTPGYVRGDLSASQICATKWGSDARFVTAKMKQDAIAAYAFDVSACPFTVYKGKRVHRLEIDHLVPRSLGGADDERNLWNKSQQAFGAHKKDRLETELHKRLCQNPSDQQLGEYQQKFEANWISLYYEIYGDE